MLEATGNLWTYDAKFRCITTNGTIKKNGEAVMGRGCALEAKEKYPNVPIWLGAKLKATGNHVYWLTSNVYSFPVKHHWRENADLNLIEQSAIEISAIIRHSTVVLPRPGCGNGGRDWEKEVKPILEPILDDKFIVISFS
jgi:hypothetical protein